MLVAYPVFVEQLGHFFGDHVTVIWNRDERDFLARFRNALGRERFSFRLFWLVVHAQSIHCCGGEKGIYSKASSEERSGNCRLQPKQVTK